MPLTTLPKLNSPALYKAFDVLDALRAEIVEAARGNKAARTRLRVKISEVIKLFHQARKEIPPVGKEKPMEKFGVHENENATKTAGDTTKCPKCGAEVSVHGAVTLCPNCGSEPYETDEEKTTEK